MAGAPRALKGPAARAVFAELVPVLIDHIARGENPDAALVTFDRFLGNLHGGARLFSLLRQNPDLIALIALVLGTAPRLADSLAQFPDVMDAVIDPSFFGARTVTSSLAPSDYISAVSKKLMPESTACLKNGNAFSSSRTQSRHLEVP